MRAILNWFVLFTLFAPGQKSGSPTGLIPLLQTGSPNVVIRSPVGGEAVQGTVSITGSANPVGFESFELAFKYIGDTTNTWFLITEGTEQVRNTTLAEWNTFSITDGDYDLRLRVRLDNGSFLEDRVAGIRIRNYTQIETSTPQLTATPTDTPTPDLTAMFTPSPTATATPEPTLIPTATPLPRNPAEFYPGEISLTILRGAAGVLVAFILLGIYTSIRSPRR